MPRYAINPVRVLTTQYIEAPDALDAVNRARRALIQQATHGELEIARLRDHPEAYDQSRDGRQDESGNEREGELRRRWFGIEEQ